ncbi:unnamed protein product [Adineta ricciae]|uniref:Uncharacterized protein n=1 Tax=Adineta ricciae TaxID=249248 RepID=A0A814V1J3_ADIRI|nr:unnamed protein product [Adineta ricciae]
MLIIYTLFSLTCFVYSSALRSSELHIHSGGRALSALQRLLNFFESNPKNLNVDGLYGLRIAQGQLQALEQMFKSAESKRTHLTDHNQIVSMLLTQTERIANISLDALVSEQTSYLNQFFLVASKPFVIEYENRRIDKNFIVLSQRSSQFDEDDSDQCFVQLFESSRRVDIQKCTISESCWSMLTDQIGKDYRLTHQLLWFLIAKNIGCINQKFATQHLNRLEDLFCTNIYEDAKLNFVNHINQDLFLEQVLLCSMIGYQDFLRSDWFHAVLTWQHPEYDCFSEESEQSEYRSRNRRHLLVEQEMDHGCLAHKSGLAAGLLATYSRVFLQEY